MHTHSVWQNQRFEGPEYAVVVDGIDIVSHRAILIVHPAAVQHTVSIGNDGDFEVSYTPVKFTRLTPEELQEKNAGLKSVAAIDDE